ncbi:MAG TPA: NAD(P)/FAD-dependent oxidoreductase [Steroidobacteraceae bacterium]|nr:NAD(P)/FAD-dependent oxidoreductase [Steroidobacteraceae bacterium]
MEKRIQIVVAGGGAGGLELVRRLGAHLGGKCDIILLEPQQTHVWKPLLHEVAAGSLDANLDETGYREHAHRWRYRFFQGRLEGIDREQRQVIVAPILDEDGSELVGRQGIRYDYLVIAIGSVTNSYGTPGADRQCIFLDDRAAADRFRLKLLNQCLRVSRQMSADPESDARVRVAIVGGGATGVELAAELYNAAAALKYYGLETFDESRLEITLLEAGKRILPALPDKLAAAATEELRALGVRVLTGARVAQVVGNTVVFAGGGSLATDLRVWAAGVKAPDFLKDIGGLETNAASQLVVGPTLQSTRDPRIFVIGDCAAFTPAGAARPVPPRAQAAHQMASCVARSLRRMIAGGDAVPFTYRDYGSLVSLSRYSTVGSLMGGLVGGKLAIEGRLARLVYVSLYQMHLFAIHGWVRGLFLIAIGRVNHVIRPRLKLH